MKEPRKDVFPLVPFVTVQAVRGWLRSFPDMKSCVVRIDSVIPDDYVGYTINLMRKILTINRDEMSESDYSWLFSWGDYLQREVTEDGDCHIRIVSKLSMERTSEDAA